MKILRVILISLLVGGCGTTGFQGEFKSNGTAEIRPIYKESDAWWAWMFPTKLPAGKYRLKEGDKEFEVDTKTEMKLLDLNLSKVGK